MVGMIIIGLIIFVIREMYKGSKKYKRLDEVNDKLEGLEVRESVVSAREKAHKKEKKVLKREGKLDGDD